MGFGETRGAFLRLDAQNCYSESKWNLWAKRLIKTPNSAEMVLIIFWPIASTLTYYSKGSKFGEKPLYSPNPIKMRLLGYFGM